MNSEPENIEEEYSIEEIEILNVDNPEEGEEEVEEDWKNFFMMYISKLWEKVNFSQSETFKKTHFLAVSLRHKEDLGALCLSGRA